MKYFKIILFTLGVASFYFSCKKQTPQLAATDADFTSSATVQVFNATVKAARNYVYVDGVPVSGSALSYGGVFPATAFAIKLPSGLRSFVIKDTSATTTQVPLTFSQTLQAGKKYTIFTYDTITSVKQLMVENNITIPTDTICRLRFANFIYNTTPVANVDVYSFRRGGVGGTTAASVFTNVPTAGVTDFIPYASGLTDTLYVYATGTTFPLLFKGFVTSLTPTRSYTSCYNGSYKATKAINTFATY